MGNFFFKKKGKQLGFDSRNSKKTKKKLEEGNWMQRIYQELRVFYRNVDQNRGSLDFY